MTSQANRSDGNASGPASGTGGQIVVARRTGRPPLRFMGALSLDLDWGCVGSGSLTCTVWTVKSGGYVFSHSTWDDVSTGQAAARVTSRPALLAALEAAAHTAGAFSAPKVPPEPSVAVAAIRHRAIHAAWADAFRDLIGEVLYRLETRPHHQETLT